MFLSWPATLRPLCPLPSKVREVDLLVPISGHNGEWLGVMGGAWGAFLRLGDAERATEVEEMMRRELDREARAFRHVRLLKQSAAGEPDSHPAHIPPLPTPLLFHSVHHTYHIVYV